LERDARNALDAAIRAVQPEVLIKALGSEVWSQTETPGRLVLMAVGKASESMTRAVLPRLRKTPSLVFITAPRESRCALEGAEIIHAGHPVPDRNSLKAARRALEIASSLGPSDRLICLVSGGGSAMWAGVPDGLSLGDIRRTNGALLGSSVSIDNVNTVRRALSTIKAGRLAEAAYPARILTILLSDVPGDDPSTIASGPSIPSSVDPAAALEILADSDIVVPRSVTRYLQEAAHRGDRAAGRSLTWSLPPVILGRNRDAVDAGAFHLARLGYDVTILSAPVYGSARDAGR
jgi:hydroxypyruvate reductase